MQPMIRQPDLKREGLNLPQTSFQAFLEQGELFSEIIEFFPYPIEVFARDGTAVMVNRAMLAEYKVQDKDMVIGKYNIFHDPEVEKSGLMDLAREVFKGRSITVTDVRVPVKSIKEYYKVKNLDINSMYQDITGFPIRDEQGEVSHVVLLFITRRVYKAKVSIIKVIEYLENNWDKPYDLSKAAKAANLSPSHFSRVFKSEMGITPYNYYQKLKMEHLMEKLSDTSLTVKEAFKACGLEYSGHSFGIFKKYVGVTPLKYREMTSDLNLKNDYKRN